MIFLETKTFTSRAATMACATRCRSSCSRRSRDSFIRQPGGALVLQLLQVHHREELGRRLEARPPVVPVVASSGGGGGGVGLLLRGGAVVQQARQAVELGVRRAELVELVEGDAFNQIKLDESIRNIRNLGFFSDVKVRNLVGSSEEQTSRSFQKL